MITRGDVLSLFILGFFSALTFEVHRGSGLLPEQISKFLRAPTNTTTSRKQADVKPAETVLLPEIRGFTFASASVIQ